jgi:hypothetical protein
LWSLYISWVSYRGALFLPKKKKKEKRKKKKERKEKGEKKRWGKKKYY